MALTQPPTSASRSWSLALSFSRSLSLLPARSLARARALSLSLAVSSCDRVRGHPERRTNLRAEQHTRRDDPDARPLPPVLRRVRGPPPRTVRCAKPRTHGRRSGWCLRRRPTRYVYRPEPQSRPSLQTGLSRRPRGGGPTPLPWSYQHTRAAVQLRRPRLPHVPVRRVHGLHCRPARGPRRRRRAAPDAVLGVQERAGAARRQLRHGRALRPGGGRGQGAGPVHAALRGRGAGAPPRTPRGLGRWKPSDRTRRRFQRRAGRRGAGGADQPTHTTNAARYGGSRQHSVCQLCGEMDDGRWP